MLWCNRGEVEEALVDRVDLDVWGELLVDL
jgi:hypothetical protein